jgi:hypothetical protein
MWMNVCKATCAVEHVSILMADIYVVALLVIKIKETLAQVSKEILGGREVGEGK